MADADNGNYDAFRDCLFSIVVGKSTRPANKTKSRRSSSSTKSLRVSETLGPDSDPAELAEFSEYMAVEIFSSLPDDLKDLSYHSLQNDSTQTDQWSLPLTSTVLEDLSARIPGEVVDTLTTYGLIEPPQSDLQSFMAPVFSSYVATVTTPPPKWIETKKSACEICDRDWVPMTYHHLIPKQIHAKVLKRNWHEERHLNSVAWLCRACHSFVHRMASNEDLARHWYTVDLICEREDVQRWAKWVQRVRWKKT